MVGHSACMDLISRVSTYHCPVFCRPNMYYCRLIHGLTLLSC